MSSIDDQRQAAAIPHPPDHGAIPAALCGRIKEAVRLLEPGFAGG